MHLALQTSFFFFSFKVQKHVSYQYLVVLRTSTFIYNINLYIFCWGIQENSSPSKR
jgi:hypothetical protein